MGYIFTPGCALMLYKPHLADQVQRYLTDAGYQAERSLVCCRHNQKRNGNTTAVVVCSGCARRFRREHEFIEPVTLWQLMAADASLNLPDYGGAAMSVQDACPTKKNPEVTGSVRTLLLRMNIHLVEAEESGANAVCCGDSFHGKLPAAEVLQKMRRRADSMPCEDVVVHCVSCIKALANGGKKPRYLLDLVFGESTDPGLTDTEQWHAELNAYIVNSRG